MPRLQHLSLVPGPRPVTPAVLVRGGDIGFCERLQRSLLGEAQVFTELGGDVQDLALVLMRGSMLDHIDDLAESPALTAAVGMAVVPSELPVEDVASLIRTELKSLQRVRRGQPSSSLPPQRGAERRRHRRVRFAAVGAPIGTWHLDDSAAPRQLRLVDMSLPRLGAPGGLRLVYEGGERLPRTGMGKDRSRPIIISGPDLVREVAVSANLVRATARVTSHGLGPLELGFSFTVASESDLAVLRVLFRQAASEPPLRRVPRAMTSTLMT